MPDRTGTEQRLLLVAAYAYLGAAVLAAVIGILFYGQTQVFGSFWASGDAWLHGSNPFATLAKTWTVEIPGPDVADVNLNPPATLPLMALFASIPLIPGALGWTVLSTALALTCFLIVRKEAEVGDWKMAWALSCPAIVDNILLKQIYVLLLILGVTIWLGLRRDRIAPVVVAVGVLIAFKPNFALCLPLIFLAGHYRFAIESALIGGAISLTSVVMFGPTIALQWLTAVQGDNHSIFPTTVSLFSYFERLGLPVIGGIVAIFAALGFFVWAFRTRPGLDRAIIAGLAVSMLSAPLCWFHYTLVLVPFVMGAKWNRALTAGAIILWLPSAIPLLSLRADSLLLATLGCLYVVGLLLVAFGLLNRKAALT